MSYTKQQIEEAVERLGSVQPWWHDISLPYGVRTIHRAPDECRENHDEAKWRRVISVVDVFNKRILDVSCNDGYYSIMSEYAGAREVLGIDIDNLRTDKAKFVMEALGLRKVEIRCVDAYDLHAELEKKYDVVFCLGLLHRVTDPFRLVSLLTQLGETVVIEWPALPTFRADARFWGGMVKSDFYNTGYWELSRHCLKAILRRLEIKYVIDEDPYSKRALIVATNSETAYIHALANRRKFKILRYLRFRIRQFLEALKTFIINTFTA